MGLKSFVLEEIKFFIISYNNLIKNKITFGDFINKENAEDIYKDSTTRYIKIKSIEADALNTKSINEQFDNMVRVNRNNSSSITSNKSDDSDTSITSRFSNLFKRKSIKYDN